MAVPCLAAAWIATLLIIARYRIARRALDKTDPHRLSEVLRALAGLINGSTQAKTSNELPPHQAPLGTPTGETGTTLTEPDEEAL
jgi:hypothetical protein